MNRIRRDAWANANRIPVEEAKPTEDQGRYLHPELHHGEPITSIARAHAERLRSASTARG
jgi:trimeric autotransporter adhesin